MNDNRVRKLSLDVVGSLRAGDEAANLAAVVSVGTVDVHGAVAALDLAFNGRGVVNVELLLDLHVAVVGSSDGEESREGGGEESLGGMHFELMSGKLC